jgi:hypothetical protein
MPLRIRAALLAAALVAPCAARAAPTAGTSCGDLVQQHDQALQTADGLISSAVDRALKSSKPSGMLQQLGIGGDVSPEQAVGRGVLAALPPTTQNATMTDLLRASTAMQALAWKGCSPPGFSN